MSFWQRGGEEEGGRLLVESTVFALAKCGAQKEIEVKAGYDGILQFLFEPPPPVAQDAGHRLCTFGKPCGQDFHLILANHTT